MENKLSETQWPVFQPMEAVPISAPNPFQQLTHLNRMKQDGYTIIRQVLPADLFPILNTAIDTLTSQDLLPVGIITHPLFWQILDALDPIIALILKEPYVILPEFWAWDIPPHKGNKGWPPHREKLFSCVNDQGMPLSVSCWFPLTPATPENSCMYVLPIGDDPHYPTGDTSFDVPLQAIRALPANPGDIILFNHNILHWGSQSSQWGHNSRRAIAFETQVSTIPPYNTPVFEPNTTPSRSDTIDLYYRMLTQYDHIKK